MVQLLLVDFGYTPSEVYMSAKQCEDNVALTRAIYDMRIKDLQEKTGIYNYFNDKFCQVEKQVAALEQAKPYEQKIFGSSIPISSEPF